MSAKEIHIPQQPISKPAFQSATAQLTPDYLDSIINNPNEHPQVKKQAEQMKKSLFGKLEAQEEAPVPVQKPVAKVAKKDLAEEDFLTEQPVVRKKAAPKPPVEEVEVETEEEEVVEQVVRKLPATIKQTKAVTQAAPSLQIKPVANDEFDSFLAEFKNNLFNDEFAIPSSPETKIQLRSMTVSEYKFLSKQFEIYQRSLDAISKDTVDVARESDIRESILTNAIDNVLQRCITNNIRVYDLTLFDWVYAMLAVRAISRGTEENLKLRCNKKDCNSDIKVGVATLMEKIEESKAKFIVNPVGIIPVKDGINLYLGLPTRGDLVEAQKIFLGDEDTSLGFVNIAMYIKAYVDEQNTAHLLNPQQRFALMNALQYDIIKQVKEKVNQNFQSFYDCLGEIKCTACGKTMEVDVSDFILFFYDF